ncbi:hypothetical protein [Sorangium sp. So ce388]|uniref:hypothetical protein n=1 Tax=Sorangium sp. So ce388 TaxID=3133309 RepID=UPI003F5BF54D
MAKTPKPNKTGKQKKTSKPAQTSAQPGSAVAFPPTAREWTVEALTQALNATTVDEDIALLKRAGILTEEGKLAKLYTSWGDKASRTPEIDELREVDG